MKEIDMKEAVRLLDRNNRVYLNGHGIVKRYPDYFWLDKVPHPTKVTIDEFIYGTFTAEEVKMRNMTQWECLQWAQSEESKGWLVCHSINKAWQLPNVWNYVEPRNMEKAQFTKDGIIESTICKFEVEEWKN